MDTKKSRGMATRLISGFEKSILASRMASAWAFSSIPRISSVRASDLPHKEDCEEGVVSCVGPEILSDCKPAGVKRIGASPTSSASSLGKSARVPGVNTKVSEFSDGTVFCRMQPPGSNTNARQRQRIMRRFRWVLLGLIVKWLNYYLD